MAHLIRTVQTAALLLLAFALWLAPSPAAQGPVSAVDVTSGSQIFRLGDQSTSSIRMFIAGSSTTLTTSVSSATVKQDVGSNPWVVSWSGTNNVLAYPTGIYSVTALSPLPTTATLSATSMTARQDVGSAPWSVTALTPLPTTASVTVDAVTVVNTPMFGVRDSSSRAELEAIGTASLSAMRVNVVGSSTTLTTVFSTTQNVLAYPTGVYATTQGVQTVIFSGTQNVLAYPTGVQAVTATTPLTTTQGTSPWVISWSGTNNVLAYPTGIYSVTALSPLPTTAAVTVDAVTVVNTPVFGVRTSGGTELYQIGIASYSAIRAFIVGVENFTSNVLAYPTGIYATTQGVQSVIFSGTQNVLAYPTGVTSTTQAGPFSVVASGTQNIRTLASGIDTVTTVPSGTQNIRTLSATIDAVRVSDNTSIWQLDPCQQNGAAKTSTAVSVYGSNNWRILTAASAKYTYLCSVFLMAGGTVNVAVVEGTGNQCATNTTGVMGGVSSSSGLILTAQAGFTLGNGASFVAASSHTGYDLCLISSASVQLTGVVTSVQR